MAEKKSVKKPVAKPAKAAPKKASPVAAKPMAKPVAAVPPKLAQKVTDHVMKPAVNGPSARTCPLVLDGEVDASDFHPRDCLTCGEFDCRFCKAEQGSGNLRSRLFAVSEDGEEGGDEDVDLDFDAGEEGGDGDEVDGEGEEDAF